MKTVVIRLNGGMGNQMFQYAFGTALAMRYGATLKIDASMYDLPHVPERYRLDEFALTPRFTPNWQNHAHRLLLSPKLPRGLRDRLAQAVRLRVVHDTPDVPADRAHALLVGYFQFPAAFLGIVPTLQRDFHLATTGAAAQDYLARIEAEPSVAVHIRRGDYVHVPKFRKDLGVLSATYYDEAMRRMRDQVAGARFFVFSNDPEWVREAILPGAPDAEVVDLGAEGRDVTEMALMRACKHFIVGNSTFSWWPALLGDAVEKVVLAPDPWFRGTEVTGAEMLLPGWTRQPAAWEG